MIMMTIRLRRRCRRWRRWQQRWRQQWRCWSKCDYLIYWQPPLEVFLKTINYSITLYSSYPSVLSAMILWCRLQPFAVVLNDICDYIVWKCKIKILFWCFVFFWKSNCPIRLDSREKAAIASFKKLILHVQNFQLHFHDLFSVDCSYPCRNVCRFFFLTVFFLIFCPKLIS